MTAPVATLDRPTTREPREACGCLLRNVENLGHRPDCSNSINPTSKDDAR